MEPLPAATRGDLDELWRDHRHDLVRLASLLVGPYDADDVAVDAFLGAAPRVLGGEARDERRYLLGAVANAAASAHRSRQRRRRRDLHAVLPEVRRPDEAVVADVRAAVAGLTVPQRAVVYFAYWEDLPEREIAAVLGLSVGTVHRTLARARVRLRKALR